MANPIRGEYPIELDGKRYVVRYDWARLQQINDEFPADLELDNMRTLAELLAIGIADEKVTADYIIECSPPVLLAKDAFVKAHNFAYLGREAPVETEGEPKSDRPPRGRLIRFVTRFARGVTRIFRPRSSGS